MNEDEPLEAPFAFGDGTLMQLREQPWQFDESATLAITPGVSRAAEIAPPPPAAASPDALVRIEQRLDELSRTMHALKKRLDSIDAALARVLTR